MSDFGKVSETLKKEKTLSIANILVMIITFMILGSFVFLIFVSQSALTYLERQNQVTVFFKDDFTEKSILSLQKELEQDERISNVEYVSKQEAFTIFTELNKDDPVLLESVTANILPASLKIQAAKIENLKIIAGELAKNEGVEGVKFFEDVILTFQRIANIIYVAGFVLAGIFLFVSYSAIVITLRTYINKKGTELEILKLVGASNDYVQGPIVKQALFFSLVSAFLASVALGFGMWVLYYTGVLPGELLVPFTVDTAVGVAFLGLAISGILLMSGLILGFLGSKTAVKKYLEY